jgi:hypothetical protein
MVASAGRLAGAATNWLHSAALHGLWAHRIRPVKTPSAPVRSAATVGGVGGISVPETGLAFGSLVAGSAGLSVAGLALADVSSSALEIFLAAFDDFGFPGSAAALSEPPAWVLLARDAPGLAAAPLDGPALAGVAFVALAFALALVWLALPVRAFVPVAALALAALPLPASVAAALAEPLPLFAPFADAAPVDPPPLVVADRVPVVLAAAGDAVVLVPAVLVPVAFEARAAGPALGALVLPDEARVVRVVVVPRAGVVAAVAVDMAFAASVSDLTADSIALVAVLIAWSAVVMVLADEVALVAAVLSFVAAVVTFVAAAETALGVAVAPDVVVVRRAGARAVVVRAAVAVVREDCVVVARALVALAVLTFAALAWAVPGFTVLGFAVVGRVVARFPVSVGTELPPDLDQIQGHSFHRRDPLHIVVLK